MRRIRFRVLVFLPIAIASAKETQKAKEEAIEKEEKEKAATLKVQGLRSPEIRLRRRRGARVPDSARCPPKRSRRHSEFFGFAQSAEIEQNPNQFQIRRAVPVETQRALQKEGGFVFAVAALSELSVIERAVARFSVIAELSPRIALSVAVPIAFQEQNGRTPPEQALRPRVPGV